MAAACWVPPELSHPMQVEPEAELVTHPARIRQLLQRAASRNTRLSVGLKGSSTRWMTTLSRYDAERDQLVYNQLTPAGWELEHGMRFPAALSSVERTNAIAFSSTLSPLGQDTGLRYLASDVPKQLQYRQLRTNHRIDLSTRKATITLQLGDAASVEAQLLDISRGGFKARLRGEAIKLVDPGAEANCALRIPGHTELRLSARLCHLRLDGDALDLGMEISSSDRATLETLNNAILQLERSTMRSLASQRTR